jgi:hypothetical protein
MNRFKKWWILPAVLVAGLSFGLTQQAQAVDVWVSPGYGVYQYPYSTYYYGGYYPYGGYSYQYPYSTYYGYTYPYYTVPRPYFARPYIARPYIGGPYWR